MKNFRTRLAAVVIAAAALVAAPAAAYAYTPTEGDPAAAVSGTPTPGGTVTLTATAFDGNTPISFTVTGENGAGITQAFVRAAISTSQAFNTTTNDSGNASFDVVLPSNATGEYTVSVTGQKNGVTVTETSTFSITAGGGLPATGFDTTSLTSVWIGGGALLAAGIAVTSVAVIRRRQAQES
jgi:hypothetical protein